MMQGTKLSFRARAVDSNKSLPIFRSEDNPDILDSSQINRGVMPMGTGMEKEEEHEIHIAQAIRATQNNPNAEVVVIPIPEVKTTAASKVGRDKFELPKQYIRTQLYFLEDEIPPAYDMDSEDEKYMEELNAKPERAKSKISTDDFEVIMSQLEKLSQQGLALQNLQSKDFGGKMSKYDEALIKTMIVYLQRRLKEENSDSVTPLLKYEKLDGSNTKDAYVAFRRRTERMQTRKNQRNVEANFMNLLKLKRDLNRCKEILSLVKKREKTKHELLKIRIDVLDTRYELKDWDGTIMQWALPPKPVEQPPPLPVIRFPLVNLDRSQENTSDDSKLKRKRKRDAQEQWDIAKKKKQALTSSTAPSAASGVSYGQGSALFKNSDDDSEDYSSDTSAVTDAEYEPEEPFRLRRRRKMFYHAPLTTPPERISSRGQFAFARRVDMGLARADMRPVLRGYCRRRVGRGGRIFIDRCRPDFDDMRSLTSLTKEQVQDMAEQQNRLQEFRERFAKQSAAQLGALRASAASATASVGGDAGSGHRLGGSQAQARAYVHAASTTAARVDMRAQGRNRDATTIAVPTSVQVPSANKSRRESRSVPEDNPYKKSYGTPSGRIRGTPRSERLPPAGTDFGMGGERVSDGPKVLTTGITDKKKS